MLWSDAGAWDLSGTDTGSGACVRKGWPESAGNCKDPAYQAAYGKCIDTETEKAGFLYKKPDEKDQRVTRIYMTEKGKEIKAKALERIHKNEAVMMEGFSEAEQCLLRRFLEQILVNIEKIQPEEAIEKLHPDEMTERKEQKRD